MSSAPNFRVAPARPKPLGPEHSPWFWAPSNPAAQFAPTWFRRKLQEVGQELECTWDPIKHRWLVFMRSPRFQHKLCQGWKLLFMHHDEQRGYLPLDERVFARLYAASAAEHGSAKAYFSRVEAEMQRDAEKRERDHYQTTIDMAMPSWEHSQIKVAMRGKSNGSKFSTYHA